MTIIQQIGWRLVVFSLCLSLLAPGAGGDRALAAGDATQPAAAGEDYLIIAPDGLAGGLSGFIQLKQAQGFNVTLLLSQSGATPAQIKAAIANRAPDYLLLVGDVDLLPAWNSQVTGGVKTDLYYATLGGINDIVPDMAYGRLPVHNLAELAAVLDKWQAYAGLSGAEDWLSRAALIATDDLDHYTAVEATHHDVIEDYLIPAGFYGRFPSHPQPGGDQLYPRTHAAVQADVIAALNDGRGLVVYHGHGGVLGWDGPILRQSHVRGLLGQPVPLVLSLANHTARLAVGESFAETWLLLPEAGALAFIGAGSDGYWNEDRRLQEAFFAVLFEDAAAEHPVGRVLNDALNRFSTLYMPGEPLVKKYREMYQLLGDPAMNLYPNAPQRFSLAVEPARLAACAGAASQASALVTLGSARPETVFLLLEGAPAGVSAGFDPPQVNPPGSSRLALNITTGSASGSYEMRVVGQRGSYRRSADLALHIDQQPPASAPLPLQPEMGAWNVPLRPTLRWQAVSGALDYQVQLSPVEDFSSGVIHLDGIADTSTTLVDDLHPGQRYYWRVRALNGCGSGVYSRSFWFTTLPPAGECPPGSSAETLYSADLNSLPQGWEAGGGWQSGSAFGRSGVLSAAVPASTAMQTLATARFSLSAEDEDAWVSLFLRAESAYDFGGGSACLDGGLIEFSNQQPDAWQALPETALLAPHYAGTLATTFGNPLGGRRAWCGQNDWTRLAVDLAQRRGEAVRVRFLLGSDDSHAAPGWALDDFSIIACRANAPDYALRLSPLEQSQVVAPGNRAVFTLQVYNDGRLPDQVGLQLASGLSGSLPVEQIQLEAGESAVVQVEVDLPSTAVPGSLHNVQLLAESSGDQSVWAGAILTVIARQCGIDLSAPPAPILAAAGSSASLDVQVANTGNQPDTITLTGFTAAGWQVQLPQLLHPLQLEPGDSQVVSVWVVLPAGVLPGARTSLNLTAHSLNCPDVQASLTGSAGTPGSSSYLPFVRR